MAVEAGHHLTVHDGCVDSALAGTGLSSHWPGGAELVV